MSKATLKSDNAAEVGTHAFERAGLGFAPFKVTGCNQRMSDVPGFPEASKPCGHCDFCGQHGIRYEFTIRDHFGSTFVAGSDCVERAGDSGLIAAYKRNPEYRRMERERRQAADRRKATEFLTLLAAPATRERLQALPHPQGFKNWNTGELLTAWNWAEWMRDHCMTSGQAKCLTGLRKLLS